MSRLIRPLRALFALSAALGALCACQALAGIEDRTFDGAGASQACKQYCAMADSVCQSPSKLYANQDVCLATCSLMSPGDANEPTGNTNTVACRVHQLQLAQQTDEPATRPDYCAAAGPGGNGTCGSNCESYCQLYEAACHADQPQLTSAQYDLDTCVGKCKGLLDKGTFDAIEDHGGDSVQCRLVHTSTSTLDPSEHCVHAQLQAQAHATPPGPCIDDPTTTDPDCNSYCHLEMAECTGMNATYESLAQCKAVCAALPQGTVEDTTENTLGCRKYHSYNALVDPDGHCSHTGPGGDGHCGSSVQPTDGVTGNCESYCILLEHACNARTPGLGTADTFEANHESLAACQEACGNVTGAKPNSHYSIDPLPAGDTLQCRLLHVSRALTKPVAECSAALGGAPCN